MDIFIRNRQVFIIPYKSFIGGGYSTDYIYSKLFDGDIWDIRKDGHHCQLSSLVGP